MSNIVELRTQEDIYETASLWLAKMDRGLTPEEEQQLKSWMGQDSTHRQVLMQMASLWDRMDHLALLSGLFPTPAPIRKPYKTWAAVAASFTLLAVGITLFSSQQNQPQVAAQTAWQQPQAETVTLLDGQYETAIGEQKTVSLPDSSELVLNTNSLVRVLYTNKQRLLMLEKGELHIQVAHDTERPLSVLAGKKIVQAVGTGFDVHILNEDKVSLMVTDGRVLVGDRQEINPKPNTKIKRLAQNSVSISKGNKIVLGEQKELIEPVTSEDINAELSWRQGNIVFRGEPLSEVVQQLGRYSKYSWEIADESIRNTRIAGLFKTGDQNALLQTLSHNFPITYEISSANKIVLREKN